MGAWIETRELRRSELLRPVAPCMGAWIETRYRLEAITTALVAPCMGAWIETPLCCHHVATVKSHPVWVRGLKLEGSSAVFL